MSTNFNDKDFSLNTKRQINLQLIKTSRRITGMTANTSLKANTDRLSFYLLSWFTP